MNNQNNELRKRIENLSNDELIEMLEVNYKDYREEALRIAKCVANDRGIELIQKTMPDYQEASSLPRYIEQDDRPISGFFKFDWMISTSILQFLYVVGLIIITSVSFYLMLEGFDQNEGVSIIIGAVLLILGNILWRIICELWIILFSIHDLLGEITRKLKRKL